MAEGDIHVTICGNLVEDPELIFTGEGIPVVRFRVASTRRTYDQAAGTWKDGETTYLTCQAWRSLAENVAESLQRGMGVIVQGRLKQRTFETKEGDKRTVDEVEASNVGPSLRTVSVKVNRAARAGRESPGEPPF